MVSQTYSGQLLAGQTYSKLKQATGIYLRHFTMFDDPDEAAWCIEPRDCDPPQACPGAGLQWHIVELRKAGHLDSLPRALSA